MNGGRVTFSVVDSASFCRLELCSILNLQRYVKYYLRPGNSIHRLFKPEGIGDL